MIVVSVSPTRRHSLSFLIKPSVRVEREQLHRARVRLLSPAPTHIPKPFSPHRFFGYRIYRRKSICTSIFPEVNLQHEVGEKNCIIPGIIVRPPFASLRRHLPHASSFWRRASSLRSSPVSTHPNYPIPPRDSWLIYRALTVDGICKLPFSRSLVETC